MAGSKKTPKAVPKYAVKGKEKSQKMSRSARAKHLDNDKGWVEYSGGGTGRHGESISSKTRRYATTTLVHQTYGLSKSTKAELPKVEPERLSYKTEIPLRIALVNDAIKICRERGDNDAVHDLYDARAALEKALHAKKPENRKHWYEYAKRVVLHAKTRSRAIANKRFFGSANGNKI